MKTDIEVRAEEALESWRETEYFADLVAIVECHVRHKTFPLLLSWSNLPDFADLKTVVHDFIQNEIDNDQK